MSTSPLCKSLSAHAHPSKKQSERSELGKVMFPGNSRELQGVCLPPRSAAEDQCKMGGEHVPERTVLPCVRDIMRATIRETSDAA